jgi:RecA-family ATPase
MTPPKRVRVKHNPDKKEREEATAAVEEFLDISDIAGYMRGEIKPPDMLVPEWLQKGVLHWAQGEPEDGKSWVMLWCAVKLLQDAEDARVLIMDGEMGARSVGERLSALGLDPGTAHARVTHVNLSPVEPAHWDEFVVWARAMRFTLIIWDPIAHHLAGAGLNEDSNSDVQRWVSQVVNPLLASGATVVGVDHLIKSGSDSRGYARGAGAKKARSRLVYEFSKDKAQRFDRTTLGEVIVALVKNSDAALIPKERLIVLGGQPEADRFLVQITEREPPEIKENRRRDKAREVVDKAVAILGELPAGAEISARKLALEIGGKKQNTEDALREAATTPGGRLRQRVEESESGKRQYVHYSLRPDDGKIRLP